MIHEIGWVWALIIVGTVVATTLIGVAYFDARWRR